MHHHCHFRDRRRVLQAVMAGLAVAPFAAALAAKKAHQPDPPPLAAPVSLIGLPYLMGTRQPSPRYGMARGPVELLNQGVAPLEFRKRFRDVEVKLIDNVDEPDAIMAGRDFRTMPYGDQWARELAQNIVLADMVKNARGRGRFPIAALGGCSYTLGMVGGLGDESDPIGMLWFDAHGDGATPDTSSNGFIEGMPVSMIAGLSWPVYMKQIPGFRPIPAERIITVGLNEAFSTNGRPGALLAVGTKVVLPDIQSKGISAALHASLEELEKRCSKVYIHVDCDVIDSAVLRSHSHTPDRGITDVQMVEAFQLIGSRFDILAISFGTWDPQYDNRGYEVIPPMMVAAAEVQARRSRAT